MTGLNREQVRQVVAQEFARLWSFVSQGLPMVELSMVPVGNLEACSIGGLPAVKIGKPEEVLDGGEACIKVGPAPGLAYALPGRGAWSAELRRWASEAQLAGAEYALVPVGSLLRLATVLVASDPSTCSPREYSTLTPIPVEMAAAGRSLMSAFFAYYSARGAVATSGEVEAFYAAAGYVLAALDVDDDPLRKITAEKLAAEAQSFEADRRESAGVVVDKGATPGPSGVTP